MRKALLLLEYYLYCAPAGEWSIEMIASVSLSVCLQRYLSHASKLHPVFSACCLWPWFSPILMALQCVMYGFVDDNEIFIVR